MVTWTSNIQLHPWIGENYQAGISIIGERQRILLLGESHNADDSDNRNQGASFTQDSIKNCIAPYGSPERRWKPAAYWKKTGKTIAGPDRYEPQEFWHSVAFYNYLQSFKQVNNQPDGGEYDSSGSALSEVIQKLEPDGIIVLCKRLWPHVEKLVNGRGFRINHPSYRTNYAHWHPFVMSKLAELQQAHRN